MVRCTSCFENYEEKYSVCPNCGYYEDKPENPINRLVHGTKLNNRYILGKTLGVGGFGITYKAWDTKLDNIVAIKEFYPASMVNRSPGTRDIILVDKKAIKVFKIGYNRLLDEARYVAKLEGKYGVMRVNEYFEENNTAYMVMEYVRGVQLRDIIKRNGALDYETARDIIEKVCNALEITHKSKIIHRDVAPDNIMVHSEYKENDCVTLIDFGNARFSGTAELEDVIVKEGFSPIEQYDTVEKQGKFTDIYALGATLYYALTGKKPIEARIRKDNDELVPPHRINSEIPESISNVVMRAMAIQSHLRYQSVEEFKTDLFKDRVLTVQQYEKKKKRKRTLSILFATVLIALSFAFIARFYMLKREDVHLPKDTTITVWVIEDSTKNKEKAFSDMIKNFEDAYKEDNVKIVLEVIPENEYRTKLEAAIKDNTLPDIFENNSYSDKYVKHTATIKNIVKDVKDDVHFGNDISEMAKENEILIYGFDMPVLYVNTILYEGTVNNYSQVLNELGITDIEKYNNLEAFLSGNEKVYYGYSSDYSKIQVVLPAQYKMLQVEGDLECKYSIGFSISNTSKNEMKVAERLLESMYTDVASDYLFVQNNILALPVNKSELDVYEQTYTEYKGFFEVIDKYILK